MSEDKCEHKKIEVSYEGVRVAIFEKIGKEDWDWSETDHQSNSITGYCLGCENGFSEKELVEMGLSL